MTDERLPLAELLEKAGESLPRTRSGGDFLRAVAEAVLQLLMEADVEGLIGAARHERTAERQSYRNGYRERALDTRPGTLQLRVPKLRTGPSYFPPFLEPRKTSGKVLVAVIQGRSRWSDRRDRRRLDHRWPGGHRSDPRRGRGQEAAEGRVDDLVQAMGLSGIGKSTVSRLCKDIDERVNGFLERPLEGEWPYLWLDATGPWPPAGTARPGAEGQRGWPDCLGRRHNRGRGGHRGTA